MKIAILLSLSSLTIGCAATATINPDSAAQSAPITYFSTVNSERDIAKFTTFLQDIEDPKRFQLECNQKNIVQSCYYYASYSDLIKEEYKQAYDYYKKAFDLGIKQTGYSISELQINYPEIFTDDNRLNIDEIIGYLKQASDAGSPDAARLLMLIYRNPGFGRVDYDQAEYYNKIAIEQNVKYSRFTLAFLYTHHLKDKSKVDKSIELYKEDLIIEKNWESAAALLAIYLNPEEFGSNTDYVKALAYAHITRDLRKNIVDDSINDRTANVDSEAIELLPRSLTPEQLKQAKALYLKLTEKMNSQSTSK